MTGRRLLGAPRGTRRRWRCWSPWWRCATTARRAALERAQPLEARVVITPRVVLFGDTVTARVQVALDRARIDPDSPVWTAFAPWRHVRAPQRIRRDAERATYVETVYVIRCLGPSCVPSRSSSSREFQAVQLTYDEVGGRRGSTDVRWPVLVLNTRLVSGRLRPPRRVRNRLAGRPRDVARRVVPPPPALLVALLLAGAALALGGGRLAYSALPRREEPPARAPAPPPPPDLTPLERALALLEPTPLDGAAERRRALEFVAEHFDERDRSSRRRRARSPGARASPPAESVGLAERVREHLDQEAATEESEEDDATPA